MFVLRNTINAIAIFAFASVSFADPTANLETRDVAQVENKNYDLHCNSLNLDKNDLVWCIANIAGRKEPCTGSVRRYVDPICHKGNVTISITLFDTKEDTTVDCKDVSLGLYPVFNTCGSKGGSNAVYKNEHMIVHAHNRWIVNKMGPKQSHGQGI